MDSWGCCMSERGQEKSKPPTFDQALRQILKVGHIAQDRGKESAKKPPAKKPAK
jgi:hypothetical protein